MDDSGEVSVRAFRDEDARSLRAVFQSSIRTYASRDYTTVQVEAWANGSRAGEQAFVKRMLRMRPFVAEAGGKPVGYADLREDGLIDHFFVAGGWGGRGVGAALMERIHAEARARGIRELRAAVSRTAEPFFLRHGFEGGEEQAVDVDGVVLHNRPMRKTLEEGA